MKAQRSTPIGKRGIKGTILDCTFAIASVLNSIVPTQKIISICSVPDFADNARALYDYMQSCEEVYSSKDHKIVWHVKNPELAEQQNKKLGYKKYPVKFVKRNRIKSMLLMFKSDYIISTHGLYSMVKLKNSQTHAYLFHSMILKRLGYLYDNDVRLGVNQADLYFVTSPIFKDILMKCYKAKSSQVKITGQARDDILFKDLSEEQTKAIELLGDEILMYLPTYRKSNGRNRDNGDNLNSGESRFGGTFDEWCELNTILHNHNTTLVIKPHPLEQEADYEMFETLSNVRVISDNWLQMNGLTLYQLLSVTKRLITDYSSVYVDYLLLDRPMCFFLPDWDSYNDSRGFMFDDIRKYLPGPIVYSFSGIKDFVFDDDRYKEERSKILQLFHTITDDSACKNTFEAIFRDYKEVKEKHNESINS